MAAGMSFSSDMVSLMDVVGRLLFSLSFLLMWSNAVFLAILYSHVENLYSGL